MTTFRTWKSFDFGPESEVSEEKKTPDPSSKSYSCDIALVAPKSIMSREKSLSQQKTLDFYELIAPKDIKELAIHAKKLQELEGWLKIVCGNSLKKDKTEFLLLTGPTGSGKSTSVKILCSSLNLDVTEWTNPVDIDYEVFKGPGQVAKFSEFFSESQYCSLFSSRNSKKVLLVKDFPNVFLRKSTEFFEVLQDIYFMATHPVIFICTDSCSKETDLQRLLFTEEILLKFGITHLSFNACAPTLLKKALKRVVDILQSHPDFFQIPSSSTVDAILSSSVGDIRCAMNQLHLACVTGNRSLLIFEKNKSEPKVGSKRKRTEKTGTIKQTVKDEVLGFFHGLGRVLNPKRVERDNTWRLNCDIPKLVDEFCTQPSTFSSFLFENYLKYFGNLEDARKAVEVLSFSTVLMESWDSHDVLVLALWVAILGVMVSNENKVSKWNQIRGPKKITERQINEVKISSLLIKYYGQAKRPSHLMQR
ncbi:cell cycle checkpoint protein RAD17 isoform X2 [Euwallacea fornicatus]|uniref:cell cycle checkpoint protein RAD17 isoform X2 n=1 Tax=Euwallacea fornicatus TaxID=995702 RepID=UPI00338F9A79